MSFSSRAGGYYSANLSSNYSPRNQMPFDLANAPVGTVTSVQVSDFHGSVSYSSDTERGVYFVGAPGGKWLSIGGGKYKKIPG